MHPECFSPDIKEPKFFSSDLNRELDRNLGKDYFQLVNSEDEYDALFANGTGKIKGDFNPYNILSVEAAKNIFNYNSKAKIIISIREPVSFLRSFHYQSLYNMYENEPDFLQALALEVSRRAGKDIPRYCYNPSYLYYSALVEYKIFIKRFTDIFGFDNVKIILFDDIIKNEITVYKTLLRFLEVRDMSFIPSKVDRNPSHALRFARLRRVVLSPRVRKWLYTKIPQNLLPVGAKISQMLFKKKQEKPFVSKADIDRIKAQYKSNVVELNTFLNTSGLLNQDLLTLWDY